MLPSSGAIGTAGTPEIQGIQKHLRKPLESPFVFNGTTLRAEGSNPQTYVLQTYMQFGSRPHFCTLTIEQAHRTSQNALSAMPQQCTMGQLLTPIENFALLVGPVLDTSTPLSPCPSQLFPILHPKFNVNTKHWISMDSGFFHLISLDFLFEEVMVFQPYWSVFIVQSGGHKTVWSAEMKFILSLFLCPLHVIVWSLH